MPMPVSATEISSSSSRRRTVSLIVPRSVNFAALLKKLMTMRRSFRSSWTSLGRSSGMSQTSWTRSPSIMGSIVTRHSWISGAGAELGRGDPVRTE